MKPGNLSERKRCQIRRQTKDEDSIYAHVGSSMCAFLILWNLKGKTKWKKDFLLLNA